MNDLYVGVDLATAGARVSAVDGVGTLVAELSADLRAPTSPSPGHREQRPDYLAVGEDLLRRLTHELGEQAAGVRAISITGTSGTVVPCDDAGRPVGLAVLYDDQRAGEQTRALRAAGIDATSTSPLARIGWLQRHAPAPRYLFTPDVLAAGLLGAVPATDTSHALKVGIDPVAAQWDRDGLACLDVPEDRLPRLVHPGTELGQLGAAAAERTGLPAGTAIRAGMTDGCTAQIAAGAVTPGDTVGVLGTTLVLKAVSDDPVSGYDGAVYSHYAPDGRYWPGGSSNVGARLVRTEFDEDDLGRLNAVAERLGPADAVRYPLPGVGERFPFNRSDAEGFLVGQAWSIDQRYRTLLEGVAFVERLGLETLASLGVATVDHRVVGGGSRSHAWNRIRATVLGRPVRRPAHASSGYGAAVLAAASHTGTGLAATVAEMVSAAEVVEPDPEETDRLEDSYRRLCDELRDRGYLPTRVPTEETR
jgi:D-ribulokinase